jgi:hypothetical protein
MSVLDGADDRDGRFMRVRTYVHKKAWTAI